MRTYKIVGPNYHATIKADLFTKEEEFGTILCCFYSDKEGFLCSFPEKEVVITEEIQ